MLTSDLFQPRSHLFFIHWAKKTACLQAADEFAKVREHFPLSAKCPLWYPGLQYDRLCSNSVLHLWKPPVRLFETSIWRFREEDSRVKVESLKERNNHIVLYRGAA